MNTFRITKNHTRFANLATSALALSLLAGCQGELPDDQESSLTTEAEALGNSPAQLREFIALQVGGLEKLKVPSDDSSIPLPPDDPSRPGRYKTTEAKRYLGKMLFHDPVRTARININKNVNPPIRTGEPRDLPPGTAFGGTVAGSNANVQRVVDATKNTGSCGSCHLGEAAGKAGTALNFNVGGEGRGYTDENGNYIIRRRPHPVQALNALRRGHLQFDRRGNPLPHGEDTGRQEITHDPNHAYKFRSLTLRQLKDARTFFHNGSFTDIRDVVSYINDGVPQDGQFAGRARTLEPRFTNPRGKGTPRGLGLNDDQVDAIADFLENGLYDPGFARAFQPNEADMSYSKNRPELAAVGAKDGQLLSGRAVDNDDPLSRRDEGLEFLDVTPQVRVDRTDSDHSGIKTEDVYRLTNISDSLVDTHLLVIVRGLPARVRLTNASGTNHNGEPYIRVFLRDGVLQPGQRITQRLVFTDVGRWRLPPYRIELCPGRATRSTRTEVGRADLPAFGLPESALLQVSVRRAPGCRGQRVPGA